MLELKCEKRFQDPLIELIQDVGPEKITKLDPDKYTHIFFVLPCCVVILSP